GSLTSSGYPRIAKEWKRGTPLTAAKTVFEGQASDVAVVATRDFHQKRTVDVVQRAIGFFENEVFLLDPATAPQKLDKPNDVDVSFFQDFVLFTLRSAWQQGGTTWPAGALLAAPLADYKSGKAALQMVYTPAPNRSLTHVDGTKSALILN